MSRLLWEVGRGLRCVGDKPRSPGRLAEPRPIRQEGRDARN